MGGRQYTGWLHKYAMWGVFASTLWTEHHARAPGHRGHRGRPGRARAERCAAAARSGAPGAGATTDRRALAERALGLAALPVPELDTRAPRLVVRRRRRARVRALARDPSCDRWIRVEHAGTGSGTLRGHRAPHRRPRVRAVHPGWVDPREARRCCDRTVPAAADTSDVSAHQSRRDADGPDTISASRGPAGRRRARGGQRGVRLPDRRGAAARGADGFPLGVEAPARSTPVSWQGRVLVAGSSRPFLPDDRQLSRAAAATVDRRDGRGRWLRRRRASDGCAGRSCGRP